jgi:tetratricopeptide (TPR) repeat protein
MSQVIDADPSLADAYYHMGEAYRMMEQYTDALLAYNEAISINAAFAPPYLGRARIHTATDPEADVGPDLNRAIELDPLFGEAYLERAFYWLTRNNPDASLEDLNAAAGLLPDSPLLYLRYAQVYLFMGESALAVANAEQANALDITMLDTYRVLGNAYLANDQPAAAVEPLETYTLYDPETAGAWFELGLAYQGAGDHTGAVEAFTQAFEIDDRLYLVFLRRGESLLALEEYDLALDDLENAARIYNTHFEPMMAYAIGLYLAGYPGDGYVQILDCEKLAETDEEWAELYYWRAQVLEALNEPLAAQNDWEALLALPAEAVPAEWRAYAQARLSSLTATDTPVPSETATPAPTEAP